MSIPSSPSPAPKTTGFVPRSRRFRATPLTPIHIGSGQELDPTEYLLTPDHRLVHFSTSAVLQKLEPTARREFLTQLERNQFDQALRRLREYAGRHQDTWFYAASVSQQSYGYLQSVLEQSVQKATRRGSIMTFIRNPVTGRPYIPGSAIKGAIRTAVLSVVVYHDQALQQAIQQLMKDPRNRRKSGELDSRVARELERLAFGYSQGGFEKDPFRFVHVRDADLPDHSTMVDRVYLISKTGPQSTEGIEVHVERLLCRHDPRGSASFELEIGVEEEFFRHPLIRQLGVHKLDWPMIEQSCNYFFLYRLAEEAQHFFANDATRVLPGYPNIPEGAILLRVGRFCHYESLSVDHLRRGWNAQRRRPIQGLSSTRATVPGPNNTRLPFGYLLLEPIS